MTLEELLEGHEKTLLKQKEFNNFMEDTYVKMIDRITILAETANNINESLEIQREQIFQLKKQVRELSRTTLKIN